MKRKERLDPLWRKSTPIERAGDRTVLLLRQFTSPIILILIGAAVLSIFLRDVTDAAIILSIVIVSGLLGFWQEHRAATAVAKLCAIVATKVRVVRAGTEMSVPLEEIVPGDIALLSAGAIIPADCRLLEARDLFVNEATLTGETFPGEKTPCALSADDRTGEALATRFLWGRTCERQRKSLCHPHRSRNAIRQGLPNA